MMTPCPRCAELEANYTQAQEELGKLDAHVIVLESRVAKLREALELISDQQNYGPDGGWDAESYPDEIAFNALKETKP